MAIADLRREYTLGDLARAELDSDPFKQFRKWFDEALADRSILDANAMTLATASADGKPSARVLLLKGIEDGGFVFYTSYDSRKGGELAKNPHATMLFFWASLERQVRISGLTERLTRPESDRYFQTRPRESQLGAWASQQSAVISDRTVLERQIEAVRTKFKDGPVPLPPYWGGYRLVPREFEFWQGRPNRMHDRLCYTRQDGGGWAITRLAP